MFPSVEITTGIPTFDAWFDVELSKHCSLFLFAETPTSLSDGAIAPTSLSDGAIAGIVIASIAGLVLIGVGIYFIVKRYGL